MMIVYDEKLYKYAKVVLCGNYLNYLHCLHSTH